MVFREASNPWFKDDTPFQLTADPPESIGSFRYGTFYQRCVCGVEFLAHGRFVVEERKRAEAHSAQCWNLMTDAEKRARLSPAESPRVSAVWPEGVIAGSDE